MADLKFIPVDDDPFAESTGGPRLVPVEGDPFAEEQPDKKSTKSLSDLITGAPKVTPVDDDPFDGKEPITDSWMEVGKKVLKQAPAIMEQGLAGASQALHERPVSSQLPLDPSAPFAQAAGVVTPTQAVGLMADEVIKSGANFLRDKLGLPEDDSAKQSADIYASTQADIQENAPNVPEGSLKDYAAMGAQSFIQMIPGLVAGFATRSPGVGAAVMTTPVAGQRYAQSRAEGRAPAEAGQDATVTMLAEAVPEMLPLGVLMKPGGKFLARTAKTMGVGGASEALTQVIEDGYAKGELKEDMTWGDVWNHVKKAAVLGAATEGAAAVVTHPFVPHETESGAPTPSPAGAGTAPAAAATATPNAGPGGQPSPPAAAATIPLDVGERVGVKQAGGPPQGATIEGVQDGYVFWRDDDGNQQADKVEAFQRDLTQPPPHKNPERVTPEPPAGEQPPPPDVGDINDFDPYAVREPKKTAAAPPSPQGAMPLPETKQIQNLRDAASAHLKLAAEAERSGGRDAQWIAGMKVQAAKLMDEAAALEAKITPSRTAPDVTAATPEQMATRGLGTLGAAAPAANEATTGARAYEVTPKAPAVPAQAALEPVAGSEAEVPQPIAERPAAPAKTWQERLREQIGQRKASLNDPVAMARNLGTTPEAVTAELQALATGRNAPIEITRGTVKIDPRTKQSVQSARAGKWRYAPRPSVNVTESLSDFVYNNGGIAPSKTFSGELEARDLHTAQRPFKGKLVKPAARMTVGQMANHALQSGFPVPTDNTGQHADTDAFLNMLESDHGGSRKYYVPGTEPTTEAQPQPMTPAQRKKAALNQLTALGFKPKGNTVEELEAQLDGILDAVGANDAIDVLNFARAAERTASGGMTQEAQDTLRQEAGNDHPDGYDDAWHAAEVAEGIPPTQFEADARLSESDQTPESQPQGQEPAPGGAESAAETAPEGGTAIEFQQPSYTPGAPGIFQDLTANFEESARSEGDKNSAAADWVADLGEQTGFEYSAFIDGEGKIISAGTANQPERTIFGPILRAHYGDPSARVNGHHNHPSGRTLSNPDLWVLAWPGSEWVIAHGHNGELHAARLTDKFRSAIAGKPLLDRLAVVKDIVNDAVFGASQEGVHPLNAQDAAWETLSSAGVIDYVTTNGALDVGPEITANIWREATRGRRLDAKEFAPGIHRPALRIQRSEGLAAISGEHATGEPGVATEYGDATSDLGGSPDNRSAEERPIGDEEFRQDYAVQRPETGGVLARLLADESGALTVPDWEKIKAYFNVGKKARTAREVALEGVRINIGHPDTLSRFSKIAKKLRSAVSLAAIDKPSAVYWNAILRRDHTRATLERQAIDQTKGYLGLDQKARDRINKVLEHDRLYGVDRKSTGRDVVVKIPDRKVPFGQAKPELTKPGEIVALDAKETAALHELRKFFDTRLNQMGEAMARERGYQGDFSRRAIEKAIEEATHPRVRRVAQAALEILDRTEEMRRNGYVPFQRYGDTFIVVKPKTPASGMPETAWFELIDTKSVFDKVFSRQGAKARRPLIDRLAELKKRFPADQFDYQVGVSTPKAIAELNIPAIERAFAALNAKQGPGTAKIIDDLMHEVYEARKAGLRKQAENVPGYSTDFERAVTDYLRQTSAIISRMSHRTDVDSAYDATQAHPVKEVRDFWKSHKDAMESDGDDYAGLRKLGFFMFLWGSPASAAINLMQTPLVTQMQLGTWAGPRAVTLSHGAMLEVLGAIRVGAHGLEVNFDQLGKTDAEKAMLKTLGEEGRLDPSIAQAEYQGGTTMSTKRPGLRPTLKGLQRVYDIGASGFNVTETVNRVAAALAYFRAAQNPQLRERMRNVYKNDENFKEMVARRGMDPVDIARYGVDETQFIGGKINRPEAMRGVGALLFQFKTYIANYLRLLHKNFTRMGPQGKIAGTLMLGAMLAVSGLFGMPFGDDALKAADFLSEQATGIDPNYEFQLRQLIADAGFGEYGAEVMTRGFGRDIFGADVGGRIGMGNIFPDDSITGLAPLATGTIGRVSEAIDRYHTGQPLGALGALAGFLGKGTQDLVKGTVVYPNEGAATKRGNQTVAPQDLTRTDMLLRSLGFQPSDVSRAGEAQYQSGRIANATQGARTAMLTQIARLVVAGMDARNAGDTEGAAEYSRQIEELYQRNAAQMVLDDVPDWQKIPPSKRQAVRQRVLSLIRPEIANIRRASKMSRPTLQDTPFVQP
jgi:hypothetical protein